MRSRNNISIAICQNILNLKTLANHYVSVLKSLMRQLSISLMICLIISTIAYAQIPVEEEGTCNSVENEANSQASSTSERANRLEDGRTGHQIDLLQQVNVLKQQIRDLRGLLEVQSHELTVLKEQQKSQYTDLDLRLKDLSHQKNQPTDVLPEKKRDAITTKNEIKKTVTPASLNKEKDPKPQTVYQVAYKALKNKNYDKAEIDFKKFIHNFPNDTNVVNAHYWLGFINLLKNQPKEAIREFKTVIKMDVGQVKTADALNKIELAQSMQDEVKKAINKKMKKFS